MLKTLDGKYRENLKQKMVKASGKALKEVKEGAEAMEELQSHAQSVEKNNSETVGYVKELNERTTKVSDILTIGSQSS